MSEESLIAGGAEEAPVEAAEPTEAPATEAPEPTEQPEQQVDASVYDQMIPLFKQLNFTEDKARSTLDKIITGDSLDELSDDEGLIFGKYKDSVAAMEAFKNLESENGRLRREKAPEAPESYVYDFSEDEDLKGIIPEEYSFDDDPLVQHMEPVFKEGNFTQDQVSMATKAWLQYQAASMPDPKAEMEALGADADALIKGAQAFRNMKEFSNEEREIIEGWATTAAEVQILNKIKKMATAQKTIPTSGAEKAPMKSSAELYQEAFAYKRSTPNFAYNSDAQKVYDEMMNKAVSAEEKGY